MTDSNTVHRPRSVFELMADAAPVLIWLSGPEKKGCTWFNRSWLEFVGRSMDQEIGMGWTQNVHAEDLERCIAVYDDAFAQRHPFAMEYRLKRFDNQFRWVLDRGTPHFDAEGKFAGFIGSCVDITEQKATEAALRQSEERFRVILENAPAMIWMSGPDGACIHLNRRLRDFWGVETSDVSTFNWLTMLHPDDADRVSATMQQAIGKGSPLSLEARFRSGAGEWRILHTDAQPYLSGSGAFRGHIGLNIDVTEERRANEALRCSEERFSRFMQNLPGLAWIKDADGRYVFANEAAADAFGASLDTVIGRADDEIFPHDIASQFKGNDAIAHASPDGARVIETLRDRDGQLRYSLVSKFAIPGPQGERPMTGGVAIDVTDHISAERRIKELNESLRLRLEEQEALLGALPVGVFIARDPACSAIEMNAAGAALLRVTQETNPSKIGPAQSTLPFRVLENGRELEPADLIMQKSARLGAPIFGQEVDVAFGDGSMISLHESAAPLFDAHGAVRGCVAVFVDITDRKASERQKTLLIDELNHRVKNTLAVVQSMANQTARSTPELAAFRRAFSWRLDTLARAHSVLTEANWEGASIADVIAAALAPFRTREHRILLTGGRIVLRPSAAVPLCLVLHELATNAMKHGALSHGVGEVAVTWRDLGGAVDLRWIESGGPLVKRPIRQGFGSRLVAASAAQLGGRINVDYVSTGVRATFDFPLN